MSNVPPVVSVIMPLYNSSSYIHDSVGSVQAQTFTDWELILIDDCSTDNTEALAREYARADHRIHVVVHAKNAGAPATARNTGLEHARGEFVTFLDHDDTFLPRKLERMLDAITAHKLDFCCSNIYLIHAQTGKKDGQAWGRIEGNVRQGFTRRLLEGNFVPPNSTLIRRSLFELVGNFDTTLRGVDDYDMWYRLARVATTGIVEEPLATWRYRNAQSISADDTKMIRDELRFYEKIVAGTPAFSGKHPYAQWQAWEEEVASRGVERNRVRLGNRLVLERSYAKAAKEYDRAGKGLLAFVARTVGPVFRLVYAWKRAQASDRLFVPLILTFEQ